MVIGLIETAFLRNYFSFLEILIRFEEAFE